MGVGVRVGRVGVVESVSCSNAVVPSMSVVERERERDGMERDEHKKRCVHTCMNVCVHKVSGGT